jgi:hypothetical protein
VLSLYVEVWHGKLPFISNADFVDSRDLPVFMTGYSSDDRLKKKTVKIAKGLLAGTRDCGLRTGDGKSVHLH